MKKHCHIISCHCWDGSSYRVTNKTGKYNIYNFANYCLRQIHSQAVYCPKCGKKIEVENEDY